jgi:formylglycine-generating enzyme required for sulfatase activity
MAQPLNQRLIVCGFTSALLSFAALAGCSNGIDARSKAEASSNDSSNGADDTAATEQEQTILERFVDECVTIAPGTDPFPSEFRIGTADEGDFALPPSVVVMPVAFRICQYETTQELYELIAGSNPSQWKGPRNSVETISFDEAQAFCRKLTARLHAEDLIAQNEIVRLPTESEWEYCCRAGTTTRFSFGDVPTVDGDEGNKASLLDEYAWHTGNASGNDPQVGSLRPNAWKLYDMHGYLWEFVTADTASMKAASDPATDSASGAEGSPAASGTRPSAPATGLEAEPRVIIRGGSWMDHHGSLTSASRRTTRASRQADSIGFRCVIATQPTPAAP